MAELKTVGRFAPTPSGRMHLGNVFAALIAWLSVRSKGGEMVLRMEDLDTQRTSEEYAQILREDLRWLGLDYDRETPPQSERSAVYDRYFDKLAEMGLLYPCYCTRSQLHSVNAPHLSDGTYVYPGTCRNLTEAQRATFHRAPAWRVRVPDRVWTVEDWVQGHYECNLATDHNMLIMSLMRKIARKHGFRVLLHEKPFKGINGSGKHNNWSLGTDTGIGLMSPGKTAEDNLRFLTFIVNTLAAVYQHNGLLKASISTASNAHRLGANEAPPAIISSFLGAQLSNVLDKIEKLDTSALVSFSKKHNLETDIPQIPELLVDNTDRNRTSPFAFTGNRFEFRAVGAQANCAAAMIVLNTAVAEQLTKFKKAVDERLASGSDKTAAIVDELRKLVKETKAIHFEGNGYSEEWKQEAKRRGLDCETSVPVIYDNYLKPESVAMFESTNVMTRKELAARNEVKWVTYTKKIQIESRVLGDLAMNHIVPVATKYQTLLVENVYKVRTVLPADRAEAATKRNVELIENISAHIAFIEERVAAMIEARKVANRIADNRQRAVAYHDTVAPMFDEIRYHIDELELIVSDQEWTLPKYRELLFIR